MVESQFTRRSVLLGGTALTLTGCDGSGGGSGGIIDSSVNINWTNVAMYVSVAAIAVHPLARFVGLVGLPRLGAFLTRIGKPIEVADNIFSGVELLKSFREQNQSSPGTDDAPRVMLSLATATINNFEQIPVLEGPIDLYLGILDEEGANFGDYDVYVSLKRAGEPRPLSLSEIFEGSDLPYAVVTPASDGSYDKQLGIGYLSPDVYVFYSWRTPRGQEPTDTEIANNPMISPAFIVIDGAMKPGIQGELEAGSNIQAQYQIPGAIYLT